jgi:hypothetical protein
MMNTYGSIFSLYTFFTFYYQREEFDVENWGSILAPFHLGASAVFFLAATGFAVWNWHRALSGLSSFENDVISTVLLNNVEEFSNSIRV